ncbi:MAG TPA: hypothetical protein VNM15_02205 [Candidatus Binatia bacterium]|nr:hypothetical protein [Candidatus Binatia bacterium]
MKTVSLAVLPALLVLSALALAAQESQQKDHSSMMQGSVKEEMMKRGKDEGHMGGMMRMMKMMDQCAAMMDSAPHSRAGKEDRKE